MIDKLPLEKISKRIFVVLFLLINCLILCTNAHADVYCVACSGATAITCDGGDNCGGDGGNCDSGTNSVVCDNINEAIHCIDFNDDPFATIRIAQGTRIGPGTGGSDETIDNTAGSAQTINILGGFDSTNCTSRTLNPSNTIIQAPVSDRVFHIENTTGDSLEVKLEGLTIENGDPASVCIMALDNDGGGVCATSTSTGGLIFISDSNIYNNNTAESGGGLAVISNSSGGDISASIMNDKFTDNEATLISGGSGGGILLLANGNTLNATIDNTIIGGDDLFPFGGNRAVDDGGGIGIKGDGGGNRCFKSGEFNNKELNYHHRGWRRRDFYYKS